MPVRQSFVAKNLLLAVAVLVSGFALVGCDDYVQITRDPDVHIAKHATWAWRPTGQARSSHNSRPVVSRDVIGRGETVERDRDANSEIVRQRVKSSIEQNLNEKGFRQVADPEDADFLVDYHFAVERRNVNVPEVYPGGYPGLVCGPFGCYEGWGWGPTLVGYENVRFREGMIVFVMVQRETNHLVYRAVGEKQVHRNTFSLTQEQINGVVHHLLKALKTGK